MAHTAAERQKKWRLKNPQAYQQSQNNLKDRLGKDAYREMRAKCFERWFFAKKYGITPEQYQEMFDAQQGLCKICKQPEVKRTKRGRVRLVVDHDHETNKVRGLLCSCCNVGIGMMKESLDILRSAIIYLESR